LLKTKAETNGGGRMRKPIIIFSLVMVLAPLPTLIPWLYDTWMNDENTSWHAAPPSHFRTTGYASTDDEPPWLMDSSAMNLDETATADIVWKEGWECPAPSDTRSFLQSYITIDGICHIVV